MSISFGGLATGLDTNSIVTQLMALERRPINRMETDKAWFTNRLAAYTTFDTKLKGFLSNIENLDSSSEFRQKSVNVDSAEFFTATADTDALAGTNYNVEVVGLAQVQKSVTTGFADKALDQFGDGTLTITVDGTPQDIAIAAGEGSLEGIMTAINAADIGVSAAIINDGTANPYRLVLTGADVGTAFSVDASALSNGILLDPVADPIFITQAATQAHIRVDNIDIYSDSNTLAEAIPGVTLNLLKAESGTQTGMNVKLNEGAIKGQIQSFVSGYNEAIAFITSQSVIEGSGGGILSGDSGLSSVKRHLQDLLTTKVSSSGVFSYLSELGLETQKDGSLTINDEILTSAIQDNLDDVQSLLIGETGVTGIATQFKDYLESLTSSVDGLLVGRKDSITSTLKRLDERIAQTELRLIQKEETMRARFSAMEQLISGLNAQSSFLTQQMDLLSGMMTRKR